MDREVLVLRRASAWKTDLIISRVTYTNHYHSSYILIVFHFVSFDVIFFHFHAFSSSKHGFLSVASWLSP